jgi:hypothetical protein
MNQKFNTFPNRKNHYHANNKDLSLNTQLILDNQATTIYLLKFKLMSIHPDCLIEFKKLPEPIASLDILVPVSIPKNKSEKIIHLITLLNEKVTFGSWIYVMDDGCLKYCTSYLYDLNSNKFDQMLYSYLQKGLTFVDYCTPSLLSVAFGDADPEVVYKEITGIPDFQLN